MTFRATLLAGLCSLGLPLPAQVFDLATNDDGTVLLFSTTARLAGTNDGGQAKIFRWDGRFSQVYAPPASPQDVIPGGANRPVLSGDASVYGYAARGPCNPRCQFDTTSVTYVRNGTMIQGGGTPGLSRNGRFAVIGVPLGGPLAHDRLDFATGARAFLTDRELVLGVTDAGQVLLAGPEAGLRLAAPGEPGTTISPLAGINSAAVSADGSRVLYSVRRGNYVELRMGEAILAVCEGPPEVCRGYFPVLSNDGSRALVREYTGALSGWAWWIDLDSLERRELGPLRGITATLSGDGRIAWLFDANGQLLRVNLASGERTAIGAPLLQFSGNPTGASVRGSRSRYYGAGFGMDPTALRMTLSNTSGSLPLPVLAAGETFFDFQIPWSLDRRFESAWIGIGRAGDEFELVLSLRQTDVFAPLFWTEPGAPRSGGVPLIKAAHHDYRGLVTPEDPARPGEVVHAYMTGLGPVAPPQPDFTPAPSDPPATAVLRPSCLYGRSAVRVEFFGLAPGVIGVGLLSVELPRSWSGEPHLFCSMTDGGSLRSATGFLPAVQ